LASVHAIVVQDNATKITPIRSFGYEMFTRKAEKKEPNINPNIFPIPTPTETDCFQICLFYFGLYSTNTLL
jgi:hypothetical protein